MSQQLTHSSTDFKVQKFPIVLVLDAVSAPANVGAIFRLADAFNVESIILCGKAVNLQSPRVQKTARSTVEKVAYGEAESTIEVCRKLKGEGYTILALEITNDSIPLESMGYAGFEKVALIVGNEISGIEEAVLEIAHKRLHINMFGNNSSMNVAQSTGIALYEITKNLLPYQ